MIAEPVHAGEEQVQLVGRVAFQPPGQPGQVVVVVPAQVLRGGVFLQPFVPPGRGGIQVYQPHDAYLVHDRIPPVAQLFQRPAIFYPAFHLVVVILRGVRYPLRLFRRRPVPTALKFPGLWVLVSGFLRLVTVWLHVDRGGVTGSCGP